MVTQTETQSNSNFESSHMKGRAISQITDTIRFELIRNYKKTVLILSIFFGVFAILFLYNVYTFKYDFFSFSTPNNILPDIPSYIQGSYLTAVGFMILILAILYGSSILVEDFENQTGNLMFPNTTKFRLLVARFTTGFVLGGIGLILYYFLITLDTIFEYGFSQLYNNNNLINLVYSLFWALLYYFMLLSLTMLFSSFSKSTSIAIVLIVIFVLILSNILRVFVAYAGYTGEPFFVLTYFGEIITQILAFPSIRYRDISLGFRSVVTGGSGKEHAINRTFKSWITPTPIEAFLFMVGYSVIFLLASYIIYERRQVQ